MVEGRQTCKKTEFPPFPNPRCVYGVLPYLFQAWLGGIAFKAGSLCLRDNPQILVTYHNKGLFPFTLHVQCRLLGAQLAAISQDSGCWTHRFTITIAGQSGIATHAWPLHLQVISNFCPVSLPTSRRYGIVIPL